MEIDALLRGLEATGFATAIRESESLFPWIESLHVLAITLVVGSIAIVDLRLIGLASLERAAIRLTSDVLPCTWAAFALAVQAKFVFLSLAGLNMAVFHFGVGQAIAHWGASPQTTPLAARIAGTASLLLWIGAVAFGRWTGFTLHATPLVS